MFITSPHYPPHLCFHHRPHRHSHCHLRRHCHHLRHLRPCRHHPHHIHYNRRMLLDAQHLPNAWLCLPSVWETWPTSIPANLANMSRSENLCLLGNARSVTLDLGRGKRRLKMTSGERFLKGVFKSQGCWELPQQLLATIGRLGSSRQGVTRSAHSEVV